MNPKIKDKRKVLTHEQVLEIVRRYPNEKSGDLAKEFNCNIYKIYKTAQRYGVTKSEAFKNSPQSGRIQKGQRLSPKTEFKKGHIPYFKGKKLPYTPSHLWKKGNKPYNTAKDLEVRWRHNPGYFFIRISENNWEFYHRYLWKQKYGEIPEGYNIIFIDGNSKNCKIENLACVSNAELAEMNRHTKYPKAVRTAIELKNKLNRTIKEQYNE